MASQVAAGAERRFDLDWLRIFAVLLLVPFHSALVFALDPMYVVYAKDTVQSNQLIEFAGFLHRWHMPLLFCIAGASTYFALGKRSSGQYLKERVLRLLIPALTALTLLVPPMTYLRFIGQPGAPTFFEYYARFWTINPRDLAGYGGTWTPAHIWFILFLLVFSIVALPVFAGLRRSGAKRAIGVLAAVSRIPSLILIVPAILIALASAVPILDDKNPLVYILFFILGYVLMLDRRFQQALDTQLWLALALGGLTVVFDYATPMRFAQTGSIEWLVGGLIYNLSRWSWVVVCLAAGHRFLNFTNRYRSYLSEAAYPFYLLHLPVDTAVALIIIRLDASIGVKYALIVAITTALTLAIYDFLIKRANLTRFLFGLKLRPVTSKSTAVRQPAQ